MNSEVLDQPVTDITMKLEQATPEETYAGDLGPTCSKIQESEILDVRHKVGMPERNWPKPELKWEGSKDEDEKRFPEVPWQVYQDGKLIRHVWEVDSHKLSSMEPSNVKPYDDSSSEMEQPLKHSGSVEIMFEQTMATKDVNSRINFTSTVEKLVKPVTIVEVPTSEPGRVFYGECELSANDQHLEEHVRNHTREKRHRCSVCKYSCIRKSSLTRHMRIHTGEKPFKCTLCEFRCTDQSSLAKHKRTHTGEKPFKCTLCTYTCRQTGNLTNHMRIHTGEKPFKCTVCEYTCSQPSNLTLHMATHTGDKPFKCTVCEYKCVRKSSLTRHMRNHTGKKPIKCTMCEFKCSQQSDLTQHLRIHTGEKPLECTLCEYRCVNKGDLARHVRTHK